LFNKIGVSELPPFALAGIRFTTASVIIFALAFFTRRNLIPDRKSLLNSGIAGFLFLSIGNGLVVWALQYIDSGFTALVISTQPLVTLLMMRALDGKHIRPKSIIGITLGMVGIALLVSQRELVYQPDQWLGLAMILICLFCWAYASIFVSKAHLPKNMFVNAGYQMLIGGLILLIASWSTGENIPAVTTWSPRLLYVMLFLIFGGSIVAFTAFNYLLTIVSPEKVATSTYVNPVVALFLGWWVLNEVVTTQSIVAALILFSGVYFVNSSKAKAVSEGHIDQ
jgi:drug/metabolite transporter (DMT)-like permease